MSFYHVEDLANHRIAADAQYRQAAKQGQRSAPAQTALRPQPAPETQRYPYHRQPGEQHADHRRNQQQPSPQRQLILLRTE